MMSSGSFCLLVCVCVCVCLSVWQVWECVHVCMCMIFIVYADFYTGLSSRFP